MILALVTTLSAAGAPLVGPQDPLGRARTWIERQRRSPREDPGFTADALRLIVDVDGLVVDPETGATDPDAVELLLDFAALGWAPPWVRTRQEARGLGARELGRAAIGRVGLERLEVRLTQDDDGEIARWIADEVIGRGGDERLDRRLVAADALRSRHVDGTLEALLTAAQDDDELMRRMACEALSGWGDPRVHLFFLEELGRERTPFVQTRDHLLLARDSLGPQALDRLRKEVGALYFSQDWRDAARARQLVPALDSQRAVPILIEALAFWKRRERAGTSSRRIRHEIVTELRRISGRSIGELPDRWTRWWQAVQEGRLDLPETAEEGPEAFSTATFFGLRPVTDRVVFVVDRSGSMLWEFGTAGRSRYDEAVDQLFRFLGSAGEETLFGVVLFDDEGLRWRTQLQEATAANLRLARAWLADRGPDPDGGTLLYEGLEAALRLTSDGAIDPRRCDADTIVVLCDGDTKDGDRWVEALLGACRQAQLVFHCVQIGTFSNGVLETLAEGTRGQFLRVRG